MTFTRAWAAEFRIADSDPDQRTQAMVEGLARLRSQGAA